VTTADRPPRRLSPLTPLVRGFIVPVAVLFSTWDDLLRGDVGPVALVLLGLLLAGAVYGTASWLRTSYWIEADELRVDTGVVSRQSRRIRVDRIQGVDVSQPFMARMFGLAELKLDVAGGGAEGSLAYLTLADAEELRETLLRRRDVARKDEAGEAGEGGAPDAPPPAPEREELLARLDPRTLVLSLVLAPDTVVFLLVAVAVGTTVALMGSVGGMATVVPIVIGWALTQSRRLSAFHRFTVTALPGRLHVRRGLFTLDSATITLARVQGVAVSEPLLWRPFGWARLDVSLAGESGSHDDDRPASTTVLPVGPRPLVLALARRLLVEAGSPDPDAVVLRPVPARARWVAPVRHRFLAAGADEHLVVARDGWTTRRTQAVPHARVQSLRLHQGPWQRRLGLADVHVDSPPGPVHVVARHRDAAEARRLLDAETVAARTARVAQA